MAPRPGRPLRLLLGAFGDPGHAFPMLALARALGARGHRVTLETWERWREHVEAEGAAFALAPEYHVFPTRERPLKPYQAVVRAATQTAALVEELRPDAVVADILTLAPALAAERAGVAVATLIPHVDPRLPPGAPPYSLGARWPRRRVGRALWRVGDRVVRRGLEQGRLELNETRRRLDLRPLDHVHGGISRELALVGTFPQLEYPYARPPATHIVGPLLWEPPYQDVALPEGDGPLVLVAPSTAQDGGHRLLRAALEGLADLPVRVLATINRRVPEPPLGPLPPNARVVEWLSYARTMPRCDLVVCHGGHGTVVRALACGCAPVIAPAGGDMNENAARVDWAGAGIRLPGRFTTPRGVRLAVQRALATPSVSARARELAAWSARHDAGTRAAGLVEGFARERSVRTR